MDYADFFQYVQSLLAKYPYVAPQPPVPVPTPTPTFSDNFANLNQWIVSNWNAPGGGQFKTSNVDLSTGMLRLAVTQDGTTAGSVGGELQFKNLCGYGRYDFVMRASSTSATPTGTGSAVSGQISSTWNFRPDANSASLTEVDAPEIEGDKPNQLSYTVWKDRTRSDYIAIPFSHPEAGFHKYSYIWSAGKLEFLVDDLFVFTTIKTIPVLPAYPMINHWGTNSAGWGGTATPNVKRYMYVKSFAFYAS